MHKDYDRKITDTLNQLNDHVELLTNSFILKHKNNSLASPDDFDLDVKAYCVLCHAALEEYIETVAKIVMEYSIYNYFNSKSVNITLLTLLHFKSSFDSTFFEDEKLESIITVFDYLRKRIDDAKATFSTEIFNNHGVSLKYLKKFLLPVGIDIPKEVGLLNSLSLITRERGNYAHKYTDTGTVRKSIAPEDAETYILDCLILCDLIGKNAKAL